jgi:hypothetical protein
MVEAITADEWLSPLSGTDAKLDDFWTVPPCAQAAMIAAQAQRLIARPMFMLRSLAALALRVPCPYMNGDENAT